MRKSLAGSSDCLQGVLGKGTTGGQAPTGHQASQGAVFTLWMGKCDLKIIRAFPGSRTSKGKAGGWHLAASISLLSGLGHGLGLKAPLGFQGHLDHQARWVPREILVSVVWGYSLSLLRSWARKNVEAGEGLEEGPVHPPFCWVMRVPLGDSCSSKQHSTFPLSRNRRTCVQVPGG